MSDVRAGDNNPGVYSWEPAAGGSNDSQVIAQFYGSIPPIASACNLGGDGAARLKIDVPESDLPEVLKFMALGREQLLRITVESAGE